MHEKLKSWLLNDHIFYGLLIVLVGVASFLLGQASVKVAGNTAVAQVVTVSQSSLPRQEIGGLVGEGQTAAAEDPSVRGETLVASRTGTKYHLSSCPGAKQIKPENIITFASVAAAEAAGYTPAANCPGLKVR